MDEWIESCGYGGWRAVACRMWLLNEAELLEEREGKRNLLQKGNPPHKRSV